MNILKLDDCKLNIIKTHITNLQKLFFKKQFQKSLLDCNSLFKNLFVVSNINNNDGFTQLTYLINKKEIIKEVNTFLDKFNRLANINNLNMTAKIFLSAFVIKYYSKYIFSKINTEHEQKVYIAVNNLLNIFIFMVNNSLFQNNTLRKFTKYIIEYKNAFDLYMKYDSEIKINELIKEWCIDETTLIDVNNSVAYNDKEKIEINKIITYAQNKKILLLKKIDSEFNTNTLSKYLSVYNCMNKAYWDGLEANILENKYDFLLKILTEISDNICGFVSNNKKFQTEFKDKFDLEILAQLINNKAMSPKSFIEYADYCVDILISLHAPIRDSIVNSEWKSLKNDFINDDFISHNLHDVRIIEKKYAETICDCIKFVMKIIVQINTDLDYIRQFFENENQNYDDSAITTMALP